MLRRALPRLCAGPLVSFAGAEGFTQAPREALLAAREPRPGSEVPAYVVPDFITEAEEAALQRYTGVLFAPLDFAAGHYDALIHRYKEFYRPLPELLHPEHCLAEMAAAMPGAPEAAVEQQRGLAKAALERCRDRAQAFTPAVPLQPRVHFLQLEGSGFIRAHADEQRNSSQIVAGLTLGSARVMTLTHPQHPGREVELLLAPRSMYVLAGSARNDWLHSVDWTSDASPEPADGSEITFAGRPTGLHRGLRTAVIFRGLSPMELFISRMGKAPAPGAACPR